MSDLEINIDLSYNRAQTKHIEKAALRLALLSDKKIEKVDIGYDGINDEFFIDLWTPTVRRLKVKDICSFSHGVLTATSITF